MPPEPYASMIRRSYEILKDHPINVKRRERGLKPANSAWFWSPGAKPSLSSFKEKWGLDATVISAVDLIKGIGICAGMESVDVDGATGNYKTNYEGKANAAIDAFKRGKGFVYVHVEGPDECGHRAELENKVMAVEKIDQLILSPVLDYLRESGEAFKIMILPDHPTPIRLRTHTILPVPFLIYSSTEEHDGVAEFCEASAAAKNNYVANGYQLMELLKK
jgi:2,3-bisphosphoglycerate-independent phosphoglycerate mutase